MGSGINSMIEGNVGEGMVDVAGGTVNLGLTIGVPALENAIIETYAAEGVTLTGSGLSGTGVGILAAVSVNWAVNDIKAAMHGEQTMTERAFEQYGDWWADWYNWRQGDILVRRPK